MDEKGDATKDFMLDKATQVWPHHKSMSLSQAEHML